MPAWSKQQLQPVSTLISNHSEAMNRLPATAVTTLADFLGLASASRVLTCIPAYYEYNSFKAALGCWISRDRSAGLSLTSQEPGEEEVPTEDEDFSIVGSHVEGALGLLRKCRADWCQNCRLLECLEGVEAGYPGLGEYTTAEVVFMTADDASFTPSFLQLTVGLPQDADTLPLESYLEIIQPAAQDFLEAWLALNEGNESRALVRAATSWLRGGSWSYAFYPADDSGRPAVLLLMFVVNNVAGCLAAVDRFVDPVGTVGSL